MHMAAAEHVHVRGLSFPFWREILVEFSSLPEVQNTWVFAKYLGFCNHKSPLLIRSPDYPKVRGAGGGGENINVHPRIRDVVQQWGPSVVLRCGK